MNDAARFKQPASLMIRNESGKIQKKPVIIYIVSPGVIHVEPTEFMDLVQRLTGLGFSPCNVNVSSESPGSSQHSSSHSVDRNSRRFLERDQCARSHESSQILVSSGLTDEKGGSMDSENWFLWEDYANCSVYLNSAVVFPCL